ncbi:hypothetical protein [Xanthomonas phaseoli]|nr:hypothetical protein [Xanthomonas phaseoli]
METTGSKAFSIALRLLEDTPKTLHNHMAVLLHGGMPHKLGFKAALD